MNKKMMGNTAIFEASPWKAIASLSIPSLISILVMMLYNMADMYFVGWLGDVSQVAAVSLAMPVFTIMMAISTMIGNGGCTKIAQSLGMNDEETVREYTALCFWSSIVFGAVLTVLVFVFRAPLLRFLGTNADTFEHTSSYLLFLAAGAPVILLNHSLGGMFRGEGLVKVGLLGHMISTVSNIILDPIFIIGLKMGVGGAAIATVLGNVLAVIYFLVYRQTHMKSCILEMNPGFARDMHKLADILALGLPNAISSLLSGFAGTFSNRLLVAYGTSAVAAMAAASKGTMVITMVQMGICMGVQPLLAYCYGGQKWDRLKAIVMRVLLLTLSCGIGLTGLIFIFRRNVIELFIHDAAVVELGIQFTNYMLIMCPFIGIYYLSSNFLQASGNAAGASLSSAMRQGLLLIPLLYIMNAIMGMNGLPASHAVADFISIVVTAGMALHYYHKITNTQLQSSAC